MKEDKYGRTSKIFGILSVIPIFGFMGIVFAILGLVYGSKQKKLGPSKDAKTGIVLSIIGIFVSGITGLVFLMLSLMMAIMSAAM